MKTELERLLAEAFTAGAYYGGRRSQSTILRFILQIKAGLDVAPAATSYARGARVSFQSKQRKAEKRR